MITIEVTIPLISQTLSIHASKKMPIILFKQFIDELLEYKNIRCKGKMILLDMDEMEIRDDYITLDEAGVGNATRLMYICDD